MNEKELFNYYKECYYFEIEQKSNIDRKISIPVGAMPFIIASDIYLINNLASISTYWKLMANITVVLFSLGIIMTMYFILRTLYGHKYGYVSSPKEIFDYRESLNKEKYNADVIEKEISSMLTEQFTNFATINRDANFSKIYYSRMVYYCLVITLIIGVLSIPAFTIGKVIEVPKIEILNEVKKEY